MRVEFVIKGLIELDFGGSAKLSGRVYTIKEFSMLYHEDPFTKWEIELETAPRSQIITIDVDFDTDKRIMSWRTFGAPHFDTESQRGTTATPPLSELARIENFFNYAGGTETPTEVIRSQIDAMDWPDLIED